MGKKEIQELVSDAQRYIIPHFANNKAIEKNPKIFMRGQGCYVYDIEGKKYLDTFASLLTTICGHGRMEVREAITKQLSELEFFPNYIDTYTIPLIKLSRKIAEIMPGNLEVSFYVNSGSEANETAIKMARQYHREKGCPQRYKVCARRHSYHATTLGGGSVTGLYWFREYFEPLIPGSVFAPAARCNDCEFNLKPETCALACLTAVEKLIKEEGPDTFSAVIMDPIPGSNIGYPLPPSGYLQGVRKICDTYGILLIFDEVQTGFGKTGKWFACEHWNVIPDIITIAKGFTGGYIPMGAVVTSQKVASVFRNGPGTEFRSGSTYGGHTVACAATLANIEIIQNEHLVERAAIIGKHIKEELEKLYSHTIVADIRGIGMLWAVELMENKDHKRKFDPKREVGSFIRDYCWERGMILRNNGDILVIAPALIIAEEEIRFMCTLMDEAIGEAERKFLNYET